MAVKFGVFVPQGWQMDLVQIKDPIEKYEAMTRAAQAADKGALGFDLGSASLQQFPPKVAWWRTRIELRSESRGWSTPVSTT